MGQHRPVLVILMQQAMLMMQDSHVREQDAFELEDGFVVHHNGSCVLRMLLPVDLVVWVLPLLLL